MPGPPALRGGEEKLYVKEKEGMPLDGETPGCILVRFELSEATSEKHRENSILYHTDKMFSANNDHNLNIVPRVGTGSRECKTGKHVVRHQTVYKISFNLCFSPV